MTNPAQPSTEAVKLADEIGELCRLLEHIRQHYSDAPGKLFMFLIGERGKRVLAALRQSPPLPSIDEVERVARALQVARGLGPDTLHQHHEWEDYPTDEERRYIGLDGKEVVTLMHYAWRKRETEARAAIAALSSMRVDAPKGLDDG